MKLGFVGAGNMATALAVGIGEPVLVHDPDRARALALAERVGGATCSSNRELAERADLVVLCCKPAQLQTVAGEIRGHVAAVASVLALTPLAALAAEFGDEVPLYRLMPNLPVAVGRGVIGYVPGPNAADGPERELRALLGRAGEVVEVAERDLDALMALASCGPAFVARFLAELAAAGARLGLDPELAGRLAQLTAGGTLAYLDAERIEPAELERRVATPGGATERGLRQLDELGFGRAVARALAAAEGKVAPS
ncbi:Pyrroline-5-carboxylate reductase [bacterium HR41]|jgi:pyrroline-5-carboxylate reductase|nr:Pyrroline-5-carboxylate reductase [bacterium HR41]